LLLTLQPEFLLPLIQQEYNETTLNQTHAVKVHDNGTGNLNSHATITGSLTDVNEATGISNQSFSIAENSANGTTIGTVVASDPYAGQSRTFSILAGNITGAFTINASTGVLTLPILLH